MNSEPTPEELDRLLDDALAATFPASDPVSLHLDELEPVLDREALMTTSTLECRNAEAPPAEVLQTLSHTLRQIHSRILQIEREFEPGLSGLELLQRLSDDPEWAWLRSISSLVADIDHVLAGAAVASQQEVASVAAHILDLLYGEGERRSEAFLSRYRPLLQLSPELASQHGELRQYLRSLPAEPENESERLHARHQWAMRCKHLAPRQ